MKFMTMWNDYFNLVLVPAWGWFKIYWLQYSILMLIFTALVGAWVYYRIRN